MQAVIDLAEEKQIFKMPNGKIQIEFTAPISFVFKTKRKFSDKQLFKIDEINEELRTMRTQILKFHLVHFLKRVAKIWKSSGKWAKQNKTGVCFESSAKFTLPNGAKRMPDAAWILKDRYFAFPEIERTERFTRIAPDFVIELCSKTDRLPILQKKMREYIENGVRLGWLIDTQEKKVHIYRADKTVEVFENPKTVSGEDVLQDFELDLTEIW